MVSAYLDEKERQPLVVDDSPLDVPPGFTAAKIFDDPTPNAVINQRIMRQFLHVARFTDMTPDEGRLFADILILVGRKMVSVWNHLEKYHVEEKRLIAAYESGAASQVDFSHTLFNEFDEFTVQIKSTLDHLVKIMIPMVGAKRWTVRTFGNKGEDVLKALKRNTGKQHEGRVRMMEIRLFEAHKPWLEAVIGSRDRVNHYLDGGIRIQTFAVLRPDGAVDVPMWSAEQRLADMMDATWGMFLNFVEDFIAMALYFRIPDDKYSILWKGVPADSARSPWHLVRRELADALVEGGGGTSL
jgi:hypothetical protein